MDAYPSRLRLCPTVVDAIDPTPAAEADIASQHSASTTMAAALKPSSRSAAAECSNASACCSAAAGAPAARCASASVSVARSVACVKPSRIEP